ncbi:MAG TPA: GNAT family N-acetyltransferase [Duganella sp.]|uniref:GNAT family N-acetyltransferase n=1 Tax=Duganella sp. TaxID=1904440 RepID=UPI002ECFCC8B
MNIEIANIFDIDAAAVLFNEYRVFYGKPSDPEAAKRFLSERMIHQQSVILLARDEAGTNVGFAQLYPIYSSVSMRKKFILNDLYVVPQARGTGRGKALLDKAKVVAREYGALALTLSTAVDNESAQQLYRSNGWELDKDYLTFEFSL